MFTLESSKAICFNPHTYMRCDLEKRREMRYYGVSIHTPTWGVTLHRGRRTIVIQVSIHTPTWGVTNRRAGGIRHTRVSIHTPTWGVTWECKSAYYGNAVSIHTPTWGVTEEWLYGSLVRIVSIHTPTWGVTAMCQYKRCYRWFQSTHLHEVWHPVVHLLAAQNSFNPHTYMRCDFVSHLHRFGVNRFNPHTYMRCDDGVQLSQRSEDVSIHTPTWGVTFGLIDA